jgi:ubiquinone/menaquinone biosynthesis C-methylase UbiE
MFYGFAGSGRLYDVVIKTTIPSRWRQRCGGLAQGRVLEVGVGTGLMLPHYGSAVTEVVGIDPSRAMLEQAEAVAHQCAFPVRLESMNVEKLRCAAASFDTVVAAFVFCSVNNPRQGLAECRRVLRPGGRLILLEHVRSRKGWLALALTALNPVTVFLLGDHLTRDTVALAHDAGFRIDQVEPLWNDVVILAKGTVAE